MPGLAPTRMGRVLTGGLFLLGGVMVGTAAVLVHDLWWGLPLAILSTVVTMRALTPGAPRVGFSLGWSAAVGVFAVPRPAGDYLVAGSFTGYSLLLTALAVVIVALATVPPRSATPAGGPAAG